MLLAVSLYFYLSVLFHNTEFRMYLPEYRAAAIQFAAEYYYQNYTKKISYSHMDDIMNNPQYRLGISIEDSLVKDYNLIIHARKLYSCYNKLKKMGYSINSVGYHSKRFGEMYVQKRVEFSEINSVKDAEDILQGIIGSEK